MPRGVDEVEAPDPLLGEARGLVEQRDVGLDLARRVGTLHLDRDSAAVRERRPVHLADRGGGHRLLLEVEEEALERQPEVGFDHLPGLLVGERPDVVLEPAELRDDVRRQDVRPHREQLAELDESRAELVQHRPQVRAALRRVAVQLGAAEAAILEEEAEPVPGSHLRDLGQPSEVPLRRLLRHKLKCDRQLRREARGDPVAERLGSGPCGDRP